MPAAAPAQCVAHVYLRLDACLYRGLFLKKYALEGRVIAERVGELLHAVVTHGVVAELRHN